jgi:hypothetical protein
METQTTEKDTEFEKIKKELEAIGKRNPYATVISTKNTILAKFDKHDDEGHHGVELTITKDDDSIKPFLSGHNLVEDEWQDLERALTSFRSTETMFFSKEINEI